MSSPASRAALPSRFEPSPQPPPRPIRRPLVARAAALALALIAVASISAAAPLGCAQKTPCTLNSDCVNSYCSNGECTKDCVDPIQDCPKNYTCNVNAQCEAPDSSSGGGAATSGPTTSAGPGGGGGDDGGASTTAASTSTTSTSVGPGSGGGGTGGSNTGNTTLDLCAADADCAPNLVCRSLVYGGKKRCTPKCSSNSSCPAGTRCEDIDGTKYCAGDDTGRPCSDPTPCNFACISPGPNYCTVECSSAFDCANGYGCMEVGGYYVCVKAEAPCSSQDASACVVPALCDESLIVGGCTTLCASSADCPQRAQGLPTWQCDSGICFRPTDVNGPLEGGYAPAQYACDAFGSPVNLCNDNQHIDFTAFTIPSPPFVDCNSPVTTDGKPGDACVDSCRYQGGCRFGFSCVAVGGIGNARIGLCLPSGVAEVGAACGTDAQCAFGYCHNSKCSRDCTDDGVCPSGFACVAGGAPAVEGLPFRRCE